MTEYRLYGPPGTGKTYALANTWVPRAADRFGAEQIMVASLTKTAAAEIASRLPIPRDRIGTLHSHAYRALGSPSLFADGDVQKDWAEQHPNWAISGGGSIDEGDREVAMGGASEGARLMEQASLLRNRCTPREMWPVDVAHFYGKYEAFKQEREVIDFDDMIALALERKLPPPNSPDVLIVDEAQDSSALELGLIRHWGTYTDHIVLAGDGDQLLYEWRGASIDDFLADTIPSENIYTLEQSFRVPRSVHTLAREWIERAGKRYAVNYRPRDYEGEVLRSVSTTRMAPMFMSDLRRSLDRGPHETVMVMASCSYQLRSVIRELRQQGIPFHNPYRKDNGMWNPLRGGVERLRDFLRPHPTFAEHAKTEPRLWNVREIKRWLEPLRASCVPRGTKARIDREVQMQRRRDTIGPVTAEFGRELLGELFDHLYDVFRNAGGNPLAPVRWYEANVMPSKVKSLQYALDIVERQGLSGLLVEPRVIVGTIHSCKGGEADHVHLFPDLAPQAYQGWAAGGAARDAVIRQFYVGVTRARQTLTLHRQAEPRAVDI